MVPKRLIDFAESLADKQAAQKLLKKMRELDASSGIGPNKQYITKVAYYVEDDETTGRSAVRLLFTSLQGKASFNVLTGDIAKFISEKQVDSDGNTISVYGVLMKDYFTDKETAMLERYNSWCLKKIAKDEAKEATAQRWDIGDIIALRSKIRDGSKKTYKKFIVKKVIWSVNSNPVNILVLKQIEGPMNNLTLTKADCKKYHIKYEEGLQVYSMMMNFTKIGKEKKNENRKLHKAAQLR